MVLFSLVVESMRTLDEDQKEQSNLEDNEQSLDESSIDSDNVGDGDTDADVEEEENDEDPSVGNVGWANTFAKVLHQEKPKNKKYLVLSRAKKLSERHAAAVDEEKKLSFEIEQSNADSEAKTEKNRSEDVDEKPVKERLQLALLAQKERNNKLLDLRVKPSLMDRERERAFKRIANKGVVQLFNAVRSQQRDLVDQLEKAGPLDHRRDAVLNNINKRQFLDVLMGGKRAKSENIDKEVKEERDDDGEANDDGRTSQWSVLR